MQKYKGRYHTDFSPGRRVRKSRAVPVPDKHAPDLADHGNQENSCPDRSRSSRCVQPLTRLGLHSRFGAKLLGIRFIYI